MATIDPKLVKSLSAARNSRLSFALLVKGSDGKLFVDRSRIGTAEIAAAKKEIGGGTLYQGKCQGEENGSVLVFEVASKPPDNLDDPTKKIIKKSTGLSFKAIVFRVNANVESEPDEGEVRAALGAASANGPEKTKPQRDEAGDFPRRMKLLVPQLLSAFKTGQPQAQTAKTKVTEANTFFRNKDFDRAIGSLGEAEKLVLQAQAGGAARQTGDAAEWKKQLAAVEPRYDEALKAHLPQANKLRALMTFAVGKAAAGEHGKALAALKQLVPLLGTTIPGQMGPAANGRTNTPPEDEAFRKAWLAAKSDLQAAVDSVTDQLAEFAGALMETGEENLVWVAEEGLGQVLSALRGAAMTVDRATSKSAAKTVAKARPAIASLRKQLKTPRVSACDQNKLGVSVSIDATIGEAIQKLELALALAGKD
jgi:hypothetical protein